MFHPKSPYFAVCADVVVTTPVVNYNHIVITYLAPKWIDPSSSSSSDNQSEVVPSSGDKDLSSLPLEKDGKQNP
ncbi:MAG: hypothetical protein CM15mV13_2100 [uncultured marine virus]|nr:MAG: hypothetical protein CM15mV13_2100 [uncultured marine virus]